MLERQARKQGKQGQRGSRGAMKGGEFGTVTMLCGAESRLTSSLAAGHPSSTNVC